MPFNCDPVFARLLKLLGTLTDRDAAVTLSGAVFSYFVLAT